MPVQRSLTERQQKFIDAYLDSGVASTAAILAGYSAKTARAQAARLLTNVGVRSAVQQRQDAIRTAHIATRAERQAFWTQLQNDLSLRPLERLKASELLARSHGDFLDRTELTGPNGGPIQIGTTVVHELIHTAIQPQLQAPSHEDSDGSDV